MFPYERFAYNLLDIAIEALNLKGLPEQVRIDFSTVTSDMAPWVINASVECELDAKGAPIAFRFSTPELIPALVYLYCVSFGSKFVDRDIEELRLSLQRFVDGGSAGVREYRRHGFASAVRAAYEYLEVTIEDLQGAATDYDLLTKQIAFHEVGHAYALHLTQSQDVSLAQRKGFELVADLLATTWFYNKMVRNTPDSSEYRQMRGFNSHSESIFNNCLLAQRSQQALLCFVALAGAQRSNGRLTLEGGKSHPPGMQRYALQHIHFETLVRSNFSTVISAAQLATLENDWVNTIEKLVAAGLVPLADITTNLDPRECDTVEVAANVIEQMNVQELQPAVPVLRGMREVLTTIIKTVQAPNARRHKKRKG